ncbi:MAG: hypothetical protein Q9208_003567 [Pyrenodesmia sp. 3 TL-2023]
MQGVFLVSSKVGDDGIIDLLVPNSEARLIIYISIVIAAESEHSGGKHIWDTTIGDYSNTGLHPPSHQRRLLRSSSSCSSKLALFLLYLPLFGRLRWLKWLAWIIGIVVTACSYLSGFVVAFAAMRAAHGHHHHLARDVLSKRNVRNGLQEYGIAHGIFGLGTDFYLSPLHPRTRGAVPAAICRPGRRSA